LYVSDADPYRFDQPPILPNTFAPRHLVPSSLRELSRVAEQFVSCSSRTCTLPARRPTLSAMALKLVKLDVTDLVSSFGVPDSVVSKETGDRSDTSKGVPSCEEGKNGTGVAAPIASATIGV